MADAKLPAEALTHESVYRSLGHGRSGLVGIGTMLKQRVGWDHRDLTVDHYSLVWLLRGAGRYHESGGRVHEFAAGALFQRFAGIAHSTEITAPGWMEAWVAIPASFQEALERTGVLDRTRPVLPGGHDRALLRDLLAAREELRGAPDSALPLLLGRQIGLLARLLRMDERAVGRPAPVVDEACRRLAAEPDLPLRRLARDLGLSYERFRKVFRARTGLAPHEYRIRRRIDRARALLYEEGRSLASIAEELGYANAFQFSAQFRQVVGVPPSRYRRR